MYDTEISRQWSEASLQELVDYLRERQSALQRPLIVAVCGGTATGKSTQVTASLLRALGDEASLLTQDHFQNRPGVRERVRDRYRMDDPINYGLDEVPGLLQRLQGGKAVEIPRYVFRKRRHEGSVIIRPRPFILFEGLYSAFEDCRFASDVIIYVEMKALGRVLRRGFRGLYERYGRVNFARVLEGFCTSVMAAHLEFVKQQREYADFIFNVPYSFEETLNRYSVQPIYPASKLPRRGPVLKEYRVDESARLRLIGTEAANWTEVRFQHDDDIYFCFSVGPDLGGRILATDWDGY